MSKPLHEERDLRREEEGDPKSAALSAFYIRVCRGLKNVSRREEPDLGVTIAERDPAGVPCNVKSQCRWGKGK